MACIGCLPLWLPCRRKASYCPWQGAWNEVYGGYGAYTKSTAHRRGNSLDDMDIGSIEDTRGQQIEHGARVGMEIAQLTSWSSLNIFHHFSSWSQRGPRFYGWPFWFISFWETWDDLGNPWPWSKAPADPRGRRSDLSQHKAVTIFDVTRWPGRAACGAKSLPCTAWSWCPCWFWCGHTEFSVMLVDVGWCWQTPLYSFGILLHVIHFITPIERLFFLSWYRLVRPRARKQRIVWISGISLVSPTAVRLISLTHDIDRFR